MWYCWLQYLLIFWACPSLSTLHHYGSSGSFNCSSRHRKSQGGRGLLNRHLCPRNWDPTWWKIWDATLGKMDFLHDLPKNLTKVSQLVKLAMNLPVMLPWLYRGWFEWLPSSLQNHSIPWWHTVPMTNFLGTGEQNSPLIEEKVLVSFRSEWCYTMTQVQKQ